MQLMAEAPIWVLSGASLLGVAVWLRRLYLRVQYFKLMADNLPTIVWTIYVRRGTLRLNKRWESFSGSKVREVKHSSYWRDFVHPDDQEETFARIRNHIRQEEPFQVQFRLRRHDGEYRWILNLAQPLRDKKGRYLGYVGNFLDITEQRQAIDEAIEEKNFSQTVMNAIRDSIFVKDDKHRYIAGNKAFWELMGGNKEDYIGRDEYGLFPDEVVEQFWVSDKRVMQTGEPMIFDDEVIWNNGKRIIATSHKSPFPFLDGRVGVVAVVHDVTEQKEVEMELQRHRHHLQELVEEKTLEMRQAKEEAERANRAKSQFLTNMSHELRTPMHAILAFSRQASKRGEGMGDEKLLQQMDNIQQSGKRLLELLNDLLDLSRLEAGKMRFDMQRQDLRKVVQTALREIDPLLQARRMAVDFEPNGVESFLTFDRKTMTQLFINLLSNAIKFSPEKSTLSVSFHKTDLVIPQGEPIPALECWVDDEGSGIPEGEREQVFDTFVQGSKNPAGAGGTGLGLPISRQIVQAHGGKICVSSTPEGGARFHVVLPYIPYSVHEDDIAEQNNAV